MKVSLPKVNPRVRDIRDSPHYALKSRAERITTQLSQGVWKPFGRVIDVCSINPHQAGVQPVSFIRQVLAVCLYPDLLNDDSFPQDVRLRAQRLLEACDGGSVGAYTPSSGLAYVRCSIAEFITRRDAGVPTDVQNIFISSGSQAALLVVVKLLGSAYGEPQTGVLAPLPGPHTLPMVLEDAGVRLVPYRLWEHTGWAVDLEELHRALLTARGSCRPRAIYISNPGDPTGHLQDRKSIEEVIKFAAAEGLFLLVDEVHQNTVYGPGREFLSYKKVLFEMGQKYWETVEMALFHSLSNGVMGECGLRGGYMEVVNVQQEVMRLAETMLCFTISSPVMGQLALDLMLHPPRPAEPSYQTYTQEMVSRQTGLAQNAQRARAFLNALPGVSCRPGVGGVYVYPRVDMPPGMVARAEAVGVEADVLYCQDLLEEQGVCVGAGSENGHPGDYHLRLCVMVPPVILEEVLERLSTFHLRLLETVNPPERGSTTTPVYT